MLRLALVLFCCGVLPLSAARMVITGTLTGAGATPVEKGHVHLLNNNSSVEVGRDGSYRVELDDPEPSVFLRFSGASHASVLVPILRENNDETLRLDVQLAPNTVPPVLDHVVVIGDFNGFDFSSGVAMTMQPDGTYTADFTTDSSTFAYQVLLYGGSGAMRSINGTMHDELVYDGGGDYRSVIRVANGRVHLVFHPKRLAQKAEPGVVRFGPNHPLQQRFATLATETEQAQMSLAALAGSENGGPAASDKLKQMLSDVRTAIAAESDEQVRRYRLFFYLDLMAMVELPEDSVEPTIALALRDIPPTSLVWTYKPYLHYMLSHGGDSAAVAQYRAEMLRSHPAPGVRCEQLSFAMRTAFYAGREEEGRRWYTALLKEFPASQEAQNAVREFSPDRPVQNGKPVPAFAVVSLADAGQTYSSENMKGRYYLIDFWATWCGPCIREMGHLHTAYEQFKGRNFEILSLSFDERPQDIAKFRSKKWTMPWLHAFIDGGFSHEISTAFGVMGIPMPILIDPNGMIVATGPQLRGEALLATLARHLGGAK